MKINQNEKEILRSLATRYMTHALSDQNNQKRELWRSLNNGHMQKPMITMDQLPWGELMVDDFLHCQIEDPYFRGLEWELRSEIYKWEHLPADMVLNPYISLTRPVHSTGFGMTSQSLDHDQSGRIQTHLFEDQLAEMEDVNKIQMPVLEPNREFEKEIMEVAHEIFDGIAPVKFRGIMLHSGLWDGITFWKGVENCYIDLLDRPELIHAIMERYTTAFISQIEQINQHGLYDVTSNMCHCSYTFSDHLPSAGCDEDHATSYDGWTFSMAQLFSSVSPAINAEFEVPYMTRIFSYFGSIYYGCCERLDDRLDIIDRMPNIRKISCSPWSDREHFAATLPKKYIMSNKPTPAFLATESFDEEVVRKDLRRTIAVAKEHDLRLELLLKDVSTIRNDPQRLWRWSEIAQEETINATL